MGLATFKYSDAVNKYENTYRQVLRPIHGGRRESQPSQFRIGRRWSVHYCGAGFTVRPSAEGRHVARPEFSPIGEDGDSATPIPLLRAGEDHGPIPVQSILQTSRKLGLKSRCVAIFAQDEVAVWS
jgi:hypothetical protein